MKIPQYRNNIRQDLLDTLPTDGQIFNDSAIDRAILSAIEDISRWVPNQEYLEILADSSDQTQTFSSTGIVAGSEVVLTNAPVANGTDSITDGTTDFVRGTDYLIDYITGTITFPTASAIIALADSVTLTVTYQKSRRLFSLSVIPNLRAVESIQLWNSSQMVSENESFELIGNYISYIPNGVIDTTNRLVILYTSRHTLPDDDNDGSLPDTLTELVVKGAIAALLYARAISLDLTSGDDLDSALALLANIDALFTLIGTDLTSSISNLVSANSAITTHQGYIDTARTSLITLLATIETQILTVLASLAAVDPAALNTIATSLESAMDTIITAHNGDLTAAQALAAAIETSLNLATANLATGLTTVDAEVLADIVLAGTQIAAALTVLVNSLAEVAGADTDIEGGDTPLAQALTYLQAGDNFIETVNSGHDPAGEYRQYALAELKRVEEFYNQGLARLKSGEVYIGNSNEYLKAAAGYIKNAETRMTLNASYLANADMQIKDALGRINEAGVYLESAKSRIALAQTKVPVFEGRIDILKVGLEKAIGGVTAIQSRAPYIQSQIELLRLYIEQEQMYVAISRGYIDTSSMRLQEVNGYIARTAESRAIATQKMALSQQIRIEATRRYNDFKESISDKAQTRRSGATISSRQLR